MRIVKLIIEIYTSKNKFKSSKGQKQKKLSESEFSLEGMFKDGEPIPKEAIDEVIAEWERE